MTRFNYTSNVFLVNYIANNNMSYANIQTLHSVKFDSFITASYANRVSRYYTRQQSMAFFVTKYTRQALLHSLSTPDPSILLNLDERDRSVTPLGYFYQNEVYDLDAPLTGTDMIPTLFTSVFQHHLTQLVLIYRILILTYLNTLKF